jgi:ribosomal protein L11 methyltransferase
VQGGSAAAAVLEVFELIEDEAGAVSAFETAPGRWRIAAYPPKPLLTPALAARLALAAAAAGGDLVEIGEGKLAERDWLAENRLAFPPLRVGRFFVHGGHYRGNVPAGAIAIRIDAATAFGTGEHPSTRGCLLALQQVARRRRSHHPRDIGTGTGILAIAAAKLLHRTIAASDIDPNAVTLARRNAMRNGLAGRVRLSAAAGYRGRRGDRCDLVLANILARPLALMARDLRRVLRPGGCAILSGLLRRQEPIVLWPHRSLGLALERRIVIDGWSTLVLRRRSFPLTRE